MSKSSGSTSHPTIIQEPIQSELIKPMELSNESLELIPCRENDITLNGKIIVRYNHYKKEFDIINGSTCSDAIDKEYFLFSVFPNSKLHLSYYGPSDFSYETDGFTDRPMLKEDPIGVYQGLIVGKTYWIHIEEDHDERKAYELRQEAYAVQKSIERNEKEELEKRGGNIVKEKLESCSCIEGNPCVDKYCCKDWDNRYAIAKKHGWKGFQ